MEAVSGTIKTPLFLMFYEHGITVATILTFLITSCGNPSGGGRAKISMAVLSDIYMHVAQSTNFYGICMLAGEFWELNFKHLQVASYEKY